MATTTDILEKMRLALDAHVWATIEPVSLLKGPIPPGFLAYPVIGIMADAGNESGRGLGYADTNETYSWTLAKWLNTGDLEAEYLAIVNWRDEARTIARTAVDGHWGLAGQVTATRVTGWVTEFYEIPSSKGVSHLGEVTIKLEVEYREAI